MATMNEDYDAAKIIKIEIEKLKKRVKTMLSNETCYKARIFEIKTIK